MADSSAPPLAACVAQHCLKTALLEPGAQVLVAVSGGADSTALAALLHEARAHGLPLALTLAHVDHGWRGPAEAAADLQVVRALAKRLAVPLRTAQAPSPPLARTEDAARRFRYQQLGRLASEAGCAFIATAHHAGDQAETFLMRLLRGSGLVGLAGIPRRRRLHPGQQWVVRPLLDVEPQRLRCWLKARGLAWREDPTNRDLSRDRAAIRARLASRRAHGHAPTLAALAGRLRRRLEEREHQLERKVARYFVLHRLAGCVEMPRPLLAAEQGETLALLLRRAGHLLHAEAEGPWFTRRHVERIEDLLRLEGDLDLPRGLTFHVRGRRAWLAWRQQPAAALPAWTRVDEPTSSFDLAGFLAARWENRAALDATRLGQRTKLRLLRADDHFVPFGRSGSRPVRIAAWLAKRGIPGLARRGQLVLEGERGIAWVVGQRVDRDHAVSVSTSQVALLRVHPNATGDAQRELEQAPDRDL